MDEFSRTVWLMLKPKLKTSTDLKIAAEMIRQARRRNRTAEDVALMCVHTIEADQKRRERDAAPATA